VPIRIRLALVFAAAVLLIFGVSGILFERSFRHGVETSLDRGLHTQASTLVRALRDANGGPIGLHDSGSSARVATQDLVAQIMTPTGKVLETTREAGPRRVLGDAEVRVARRRATTTTVRLGAEDEHYRILAVPTFEGDRRRIVAVGTSLESTDDTVGRVRDALLVGGVIVVLVAGVGAWFLAGAALRPVERMRREAASISEHDATSRLPVPGTHDEIAALGETMNDLLARLQNALQRQRHFVADAGHELRTPLAVLQTELELARRRPRSRAELMDTIGAAQDETQRMSRLADELLFLTQTDDARSELPRGAQRVLPIIEQAAETLAARAREHRVDLRVEGDPALEARVAPDLIRRAVENLLENAIRYAPPSSAVTARLRREHDDLVIEVTDAGSGFPPDFLPVAFERFRRADDARSRRDGGTGLGLAIVLAVARAHGGTADVANQPAGGAVVGVRIPADV